VWRKYPEGTHTVFAEKVQKFAHRMSFGATTHLAKRPCLKALLMLKVENSLICLVGIRIPMITTTTIIIIIIIIYKICMSYWHLILWSRNSLL
jgi:hypothetical protein